MISDTLISAAAFAPKSLENPNAWVGHLPFAAWVIKEISPQIFVELGTHSGNSYFAVCQSVFENQISTQCYAVDTWQGDDHAGQYSNDIFNKVNSHNKEHYSTFSQLLRMTFDDAITHFENESIELLHIDGLHTYEAVRHDFESWLPKLAPGAVIMFHDTNVHERNFGVWKLWEELKILYPNNLEFLHSHGLGVLQLNNASEHKKFQWLNPDATEKIIIINYFDALGRKQLFNFNEIADLKQNVIELGWEIASIKQIVSERDRWIAIFKLEIEARDKQSDQLSLDIVERGSRLIGPDTLLAPTSHQMKKQKLQLSELNALLVKSNAQIKNLDTQLSHQQDQLLALHQNIGAIHRSFSWRLTAPMRFVTRQLKRAPVAVKLVLPAIKLGGGIGQTVKKAIKLYRNEGILGIKRGFRAVAFGSIDAIPNASEKLALPPHDTSGSKAADGVWEWAAYDDVTNRIQQYKQTKVEHLDLKTVQLVHVDADALDATALAISLPKLMDSPIVSIILPVFNHAQLTLECLTSIASSDNSVTYEIIIADDASSDDTSRVLQLVKNIKYFRNESNLGFLKNTNKALDHVSGTYVLYLNNDVQVSGAWLSTLLATFKEFPAAGAVGPAFIFPSGHLQEAGAAFNMDGTSDMIGLNESPQQARFSYTRRVDYVSGACLLIPTKLVKSFGGFSEEFLPCYCEDSDLCLRIQAAGYDVYCNPHVTVMHHLSKSTDALGENYKLKCVYKNVTTLKTKWQDHLQKTVSPKVIAFYLPQFHPFSENNKWWGQGFTEWTNVSKAKPNFVGHYQPRYPADLGYYDLRLPEILAQQAALAKQYGVGGFCFYYYWFDGKRLLEQPIEHMLKSKEPDFPFCLCWANENWTRRWDGLENDVLMAQAHSPDDDVAVINDLIRYFKDARYIRIDGRPLLLVYRVALFPNFIETAARWRETCRTAGIGEIYLTSVESFDGVNGNRDPATFGCDAAVEFPPHGMGEAKPVPGAVLNPNFAGTIGHYNDVAVRFATRPAPAYTRFRSVMPGWDNTARRQDTSFCFDQSTPGAFQAWLEESLEQTRLDRFGDEKLVFLNAWNEWAEGAYLEPDKRFGHTYLEAVRNALDAKQLKR